ncbi:NAD(P)H-binding protein [Nocardioides sp.]|uniref:NAD(P)H-binding protein n=1 Tax=Nocardioides sp. TaxID=35761 RepID=UPI00356A5F95
MSVAVTAVSGQLGRHVVQALERADAAQPIVGLARRPERATGLDIDVRPGDYADAQQLTASLLGVTTLLLVSGNEEPERRISQHRNVLDAARAAGVRKVVYTSVQGAEVGTAFSPVVQSNRQTEADVRNSGMEWVIGRNGIYIEPDIESIDDYVAAGEVANCAGEAKCGYTTRAELAEAYARMLTESSRDERTYRLHGRPLTQAELVGFINGAFETDLVYRSMSVEEYREDRIAALGEFFGTVIAGIYEGIRDGVHDTASDFEEASGRPHQSWEDFFATLARDRVKRRGD